MGGCQGLMMLVSLQECLGPNSALASKLESCDTDGHAQAWKLMKMPGIHERRGALQAHTPSVWVQASLGRRTINGSCIPPVVGWSAQHEGARRPALGWGSV